MRSKSKMKVNVVITIIEYTWMCLYKHDSKYALGPRYAKTLNIAKSWIWQHSQYVLNMPEYALTELCISWVLNMQEFWVWHGSVYREFHRVLNMPQNGWIWLTRTWICLNMSEFKVMDKVLNMYHTKYSASSLCKLMSSYWEIGVFSTLSECFGKVITFFNYFRKKLHRKSLRGFWEHLSGFKYGRVLNISYFS